MRCKLILSWDVKKEFVTQYSEFMVSEFIPRIQRLGIEEIQFWYTAFGDCEEILATGIVSSLDKLETIQASEEWETMSERLNEFVGDYQEKIVAATEGFQI